MGEIRRESPSEYIEKHTDDNISKEDGNKAAHNLSEAIGSIEYSEKGEVKIENNQIVLEFQYKTAELEMEDFGSQVVAKFPEFMNNFLEFESLKLSGNKKELFINFLDSLPKDHKVFFNPYVDTNIAYYSPRNKKIFIGNNINKPKSILALLHEIGHINQNEIKFGEESDKEAEKQEDLAQLLLSERDAWAFALKKIKPFLNIKESLFNKEDVMLFMERCLTNYKDHISKELLIRENVARSMKHSNKNGYVEEIFDFSESLE